MRIWVGLGINDTEELEEEAERIRQRNRGNRLSLRLRLFTLSTLSTLAIVSASRARVRELTSRRVDSVDTRAIASRETMHDFAERLAFSEGVELAGAVLDYLVAGVAGATGVRRASEQQDRHGTDYWIDRAHGLPAVSVDVKHRQFDPITGWDEKLCAVDQRKQYGNDACVETTSIYTGSRSMPWQDAHRRKPGWTIDATKRTDLLVFTWPTANAMRRFWILYFPHFCTAAMRHWRGWAQEYGERAAVNERYLTLSVYPPRAVIEQAIRTLTTGRVSP